MARLRERYKREIVPEMVKAFSYRNVMQVPKVQKIVINIGAGDAKDNAKLMDVIYPGEFD